MFGNCCFSSLQGTAIAFPENICAQYAGTTAQFLAGILIEFHSTKGSLVTICEATAMVSSK